MKRFQVRVDITVMADEEDDAQNKIEESLNDGLIEGADFEIIEVEEVGEGEE